MKVTIIACDTYEGVYFDDDLMYFEENMDSKTAFQMCIGRSVESVERYEVDYDWFDETAFNQLPEKLSKVRHT